jgi:hypothetical protein
MVEAILDFRSAQNAQVTKPDHQQILNDLEGA